MFNLTRLDVFLFWSPETPTFLTTHGLPHLSFNPEAAFLSVSDSLGCKGPGGTKLIKALNQLLQRG
ncbi:hypothetical protein J7444_05375 [Labrenzia sp. R4_1]|uniref:hypothetical protein n=1 Tax=Stappiaceae TaxID=2821832 RepID=UPI001ADBE58E|nr:hypothetical protein [Labrenzia sp. R4_1]MBO9424139.1 hypothetical protein [Labrenzia sp. R4_1]